MAPFFIRRRAWRKKAAWSPATSRPPRFPPYSCNARGRWLRRSAAGAGLAWSWSEELEKEAIRWALGRGNRTGRCAYQFSRYWVGKQLLERQA